MKQKEKQNTMSQLDYVNYKIMCELIEADNVTQASSMLRTKYPRHKLIGQKLFESKRNLTAEQKQNYKSKLYVYFVDDFDKVIKEFNKQNK
jgi:hypothetical protein